MSKEQRTTDETDCFRQVHEAGDPFAIHLCVIWCSRTGSPLPSWVMKILEEQSLRWLDKADRDVHQKYPRIFSIFESLVGPERPPKNKGGRGYSIPDFVRKKLLIGFIEAATEWGYTVESACELALRRVHDWGITCEPEVAAKIYYRHKRLRPHDSKLWDWVVDLEQWTQANPTET
jgi:hypothetical protein